jgi:hypothetical protein
MLKTTLVRSKKALILLHCILPIPTKHFWIVVFFEFYAAGPTYTRNQTNLLYVNTFDCGVLLDNKHRSSTLPIVREHEINASGHDTQIPS